ncbi:ThiF family adenylyltransferase [Citrobacter freundii]|uniref:ThiF family adenylyltransferase n=1 Tax=Klebsiella michiganensis TaxID=1134687 RepID=UPI0015E99E74|nr:ThiF family adenylyltransferase [Klebsiella michiganensis]QMD46912.1 ThiF family adenylyltransferase [Citrobacter freundii]QMD56722.1 ThiF family adenylyltransferase [Citrobacter freundii]
MNYSEIQTHLTEGGYKVSAFPYGSAGNDSFTVELEINNFLVTLLHIAVPELTQMPSFLLGDPSALPRLAHTTIHADKRYASICVNVPDAVSVNYERPELAFEESLTRHIALLTNALSDSEWNNSELLREFEAGWLNIVAQNTAPFLCLSESKIMEELCVLKPRKNIVRGLGSYYVGYAAGCVPDNIFSPINQLITDREATKGRGFVIPLSIATPAPKQREDLADWYLSLLADLPMAVRTKLTQQFSQQRSHEFWLIFNTPTPSGMTWFGIYFSLKSPVKGRKHLPFKGSHLVEWELTPLEVSTFNQDRLMPRSGAEQSLLRKKVLLVGCGSVGGEIADKLAASGIGYITLCDPDCLSLNNLYRHILPPAYVSSRKSLALWHSLTSKYPWITIEHYTDRLLELRHRAFLSQFDIIIIAIGSPTHERLFHDYLIKEKIYTPVINTWVEGYGIGGHAVLDIPAQKGCLRCAYVDPSDFSRGLASNLNFLAPNQDLTKNHAGCGDAFLPYTYIASTQTALITADLAAKYLLGKVNDSSKVSWKGSPVDASENGFKLSDRYQAFNRSLEILPLYNTECDICNE